MNIFYSSVDITNDVQPVDLQLIDCAGCRPDGIDVTFADPEGLWSKWKPQKNDPIRVVTGDFDSGVMYIDHLEQSAGRFSIKALSIPQECKSAKSQGWEEIRFLEIAAQLAARYGFTISTYGLKNHLYSRIDQTEEADFFFLANLAMLEGYGIKVTDRKLVIMDESTEGSRTDPTTIRRSDINGQFRFVDKSVDIYGSCMVHGAGPNGWIRSIYTAPDTAGPQIRRKYRFSNQAEADRWAIGLLRSFNKYRVTGRFSVNLNTKLAAGSVVEIQDVGLFDGRYIVDRVNHEPIRNLTTLLIRKPLEGYT